MPADPRPPFSSSSFARAARPPRGWIPCAHCGARPVEEFVHGALPSTPDSVSEPDARDVDRAFMHDNPAGPVTERWFHVAGCRRWTTVTRDTRIDDVVDAGASAERRHEA